MTRRLRPARSGLLLALLATVAGGREREPNERNLYLSDHPSHEASELYVVGGIVSVLRFERPCDPARTKMLGWEGRFEPVVCAGKKVLVEPLHDLEPEDRFLLLVTLEDGTEVPFTVTSRQETTDDRTGDQQVNVFRDREVPNAVLASLYDSLGREHELAQEVERYRKEDSVDHALAALLVKGATAQTPFFERQRRLFREENAEVLVRVFGGRKKAAVVLELRNEGPENDWTLMEARLSNPRTGERRDFALRADRDAIPPGGSGRIAIVADKSAFTSTKGLEPLLLEVFRKEGGLRQVAVVLDPRLLRE
jgi:uncharacterized protein (TIGR02268 family)